MTAINPYEILDLNNDASDDEIKKAYYNKAKDHHPDAGGDADKFALVKISYDTLKDKKKRKQFDETGHVDGDMNQDVNAQAINALKQLFFTTLQQFDPTEIQYADIIGTMRDSIKGNIKKLNETANGIKESEKHTRKALKVIEKKLKRKNNKSNFLTNLLLESLASVPGQLMHITNQISIHKEMLIILKEFSYKPDYKEQRDTASYFNIQWR